MEKTEQYAGFWVRVMSHIIDTVISVMLAAVFMVIVGVDMSVELQFVHGFI